MKKTFSDPKMTKCKQPLDKVTMSMGNYCRPDNGHVGPPNGGRRGGGGRR